MSNRSRTHSSDPDDVRWQDYEELVKDIYQALGRANGVTIECWGSSCKVEGPPGVFHQIDVLTIHSDGVHQYRTAVSCKNWNSKVGLPIVRDFAQIVQDAKLSKGIIVSKMGFTGPAKTLAEAKNIGLVELRKPVDSDWDGYIREIHINLILDQTQVDDVRFELIAPRQEPGKEELQGGPVDWPLSFDQIAIRVPGQGVETLLKLANDEQCKNPNKEEYELRFPEGSVVTIPQHPDHPAHGHSIAGVSFKVKYNPPMTEKIVISADDRIYMIMESLFDGRRFSITNDGEIMETRALGSQGESGSE